jgi:hypothetical protein
MRRSNVGLEVYRSQPTVTWRRRNEMYHDYTCQKLYEAKFRDLITEVEAGRLPEQIGRQMPARFHSTRVVALSMAAVIGLLLVLGMTSEVAPAGPMRNSQISLLSTAGHFPAIQAQMRVPSLVPDLAGSNSAPQAGSPVLTPAETRAVDPALELRARQKWQSLPAPYNRSGAELRDMLAYDTPQAIDARARQVWKAMPAPYNRSVSELNELRQQYRQAAGLP